MHERKENIHPSLDIYTPNLPQTILFPTLLIQSLDNLGSLTSHNTSNWKPLRLHNHQALLRIPRGLHLSRG
jgi:hypothetical protein